MPIIANKTSATTVTFSTPQEIVISHLDDSIKIGDGTQVFTGGTKAASASFPVTLSNEDKGKLDSLLTELQAKADLTETQPTSLFDNGIISTNNATSTPLTSSATYTGTFEDVSNYASQHTSLVVDRDGTLYVEYSIAGTIADLIQTYPVTVASGGTAQGFFFQFMSEARYFRLRYVNGATAQGTFKLQATLRKIPGTAEVHAVDTALTANTDALVTKGVIYGLTTGGGGGYVAVKVAPSGAITTSATQSGTWNIGTLTAVTNPVNTKTYDEASITDSGVTTTYIGFAAIGSATSSAVWKIKKIDVSGTITATTYADGNANYDNIWDNRASLSYS